MKTTTTTGKKMITDADAISSVDNSSSGATMSLTDKYNRRIDYLRISVTDRCNLRCMYCAPSGFQHFPRFQLLSYNDILLIAQGFVEAGGKKIRITGGEPLVRKDLEYFIQRLSAIHGIEDLSITTNGTLLKERASALKKAGLKRINVSLDTLDSARFKKITRSCVSPETVIAGIREAKIQGFKTIKVNVVVMKDINDGELMDFVKFGTTEDVTVRFIEYMPFDNREQWKRYYVPAGEILTRINNSVRQEPADFPGGHSPARYYPLLSGPGQVGIISPVSHGFCSRCNRLRLNSNGFLQTCLHSDQGMDLRQIIRENFSVQAVKEAFQKAVMLKGIRGNMGGAHKYMYQVGG